MNLKEVFIMPKVTSITARRSGITNAFVNGIIPAIVPTYEIKQD